MTDPRPAIAGMFDRASATYGQVGVDFFGIVGRHLVTDVAVRAGERVLDVGCGRGAVLFPAGEAVGPSGSVLGIDLSPGMVGLTSAEVADRGLSHVRVDVMDAQEPTLDPEMFDVVLSSLVLFFLPDPAAGLRAWRAATVPTGRIAITTFVGRNDPRWNWLGDVFPNRSAGSTARPTKDGTANPFATDEGVHGLLAQASFGDAASVTRTHVLSFRDPEQWERSSWSTGMRQFWEELSDEDRSAGRERAFRELVRMQGEPEGLTQTMVVRYTTAQAA